MLLPDAPNRATGRATEPYANLVLGIDRQVLFDADAAARPERQIPQVVVLRQVFRRRIRRRHRRNRGAPDRQPADLSRDRHVALEQQRRRAEGVRDIVEPVRGIVGRKRADVHIERQEVAHRVAVLRAIHPVQQRSRRVRLGDGGAIEGCFQRGGKTVVGRFVGTRNPQGWHRTAAQPPDDLLPHVRLGLGMRRIETVEREAGCTKPIVVARHAVALKHRRRFRARRDG